MIQINTIYVPDPSARLEHFYCERLTEPQTVHEFLREKVGAPHQRKLDVFESECDEYDLYYELTPGPHVHLFTDRESDGGITIEIGGDDAVALLRELWALPTSGARWIAQLVREVAPRRMSAPKRSGKAKPASPVVDEPKRQESSE